ncbi:MAG: ArnT family glycosyltransferase [Paracoccaceae bacterium]
MISRIDIFLLRLPGLWLALGLTLLVAMPGFFTMPPVDRDEARFAQASAQMLESGDWIDIRLGEETRYKKPIGIYWLQAAVAGVTGAEGQIWAYRLVSLAGALIAVGFTYAIGRLALPRGPALLAAVALGSCFLLGAEARLAKTDAMLLATIVAGQYVLARMWVPDGRGQRVNLPFGWAMGFWATQSASILIKGPIGPMVAVLTIAGICAFRRDIAVVRALRPLHGLALLLVVVVPWFVAITLQSDGAFWQASVGADMLAKIGTGQENHGAPPGTYLGLVWATFWPGAMLLAAAIPAVWQAGRRAELVLFAAIWTLPSWVVFELTATKLVHYVLPTYPALALVAAWALWQAKPRLWIAGIVGLMPFVLLVAFAFAADEVGAALPWPFWAGLAWLLVAVPLILLAYRQRAFGLLAGMLTLGGLALSSAIYPSLARMEVLWPAKSLAAIADQHPNCGFLVAGYAEPSMIFQSQNRVRFVDLEGAITGYADEGCQVVALPQTDLPQLLAAHPDAVASAQVQGLNIGNGKPVDLAVVIKP